MTDHRNMAKQFIEAANHRSDRLGHQAVVQAVLALAHAVLSLQQDRAALGEKP